VYVSRVDSSPLVVFLSFYNKSENFVQFPSLTFSSQVNSKVGNTLTKVVVLRVNLNLDESPITSKSHTHPSHS
jgi:hypothetical protein